MSASPVLTEFDFSDLIRAAFNANSNSLGLKPLLLDEPSRLTANQSTGLLVIHVRRGDFSHHCRHLARFSSGFLGFSNSAQLHDQFKPKQNTRGRNPSKAQIDVSMHKQSEQNDSI